MLSCKRLLLRRMEEWGEYALAWAGFLATHLVSAMPGPRGLLIAWLGRRGYLAAFSLLSVLMLVWLVRAAGDAPRLPLWDSGGGGRWLVNIAMPVAILTGVLCRGLAALMAAFAIWAMAHLVANGDLAHVVLFGGMLVLAAAGVGRRGLPVPGMVTVPRLALAVSIWLALLGLHPVLVGLSALPG